MAADTSSEHERDLSNLRLSDLDLTRFYLLMPVGSFTIRTAVYPLQLTKTRMQAAPQAYASTMDALRTIARTEGVARGLFKGYFTNALSMAVGPVYVSTLELAREALLKSGALRSTVGDSLEGPVSYMAAGLAASAVSQTIVVPIDNVSQRIMVDRAVVQSPFAVARKLVADRGVVALYRGYGASLATYAPSSASIWGIYSVARALLNPGPPIQPGDPWPRHWKDAAVVPLSGGIAGATAGALTNPIDVVRTNLQLSDRSKASVRSTVAALWEEQGVRAFYRGVVPRMTSMGMTVTFVMSFYELLKRVSVRASDLDDDDDDDLVAG